MSGKNFQMRKKFPITTSYNRLWLWCILVTCFECRNKYRYKLPWFTTIPTKRCGYKLIYFIDLSFQNQMNRLTVYSYLTRFNNGNTMYGKLFAEPMSENLKPSNSRCQTTWKSGLKILLTSADKPRTQDPAASSSSSYRGPSSQALTSALNEPESDNYICDI